MKKYGLQLRIPKSQTSNPAAARPPPPSSVFGDDDDDDVEKEISRQASKTSSLRKIEEQHQKALEEDPSVFDYDGVFDEMKEKAAKPKVQDQSERKSKYIEALLSKAKEREREHEIIYERKLIKERSKEDHLYGDKDKFVTSAYKKKLAEQAKWLEEERIRKIREEQEDVTKKKDLSEFYFSLNKNIALGAETGTSSKPAKKKSTPEAIPRRAIEDPETEDHPVPSKPVNQPVSRLVTPREDEEAAPSKAPLIKEDISKKEENSEVKEDISKKEENSEVKELENKGTDTGERYKRKEEDVAAARERYLARKRAKQES